MTSDSKHHSKTKDFKLSKQFLDKYKDSVPPFGFNGLGEIVYRRTYSRLKDDGEREQWYKTLVDCIPDLSCKI
jgi:ribonucleoside-triphosphate reductase